jgi:hypothetical protein
MAFLLFKAVIELIVNKEHLESKGLLNIMRIRVSMNKGVSSRLLSYFNDFINKFLEKRLVLL